MKTFLRIVLGVGLGVLAILVWQDSQPLPAPPSQTQQSELIGTPAIPFALRHADGSGELALADLRGQVVVLDFWALYCRPCIDSMPHLQRLHERFADEGVSVVSINVDVPDDARAERVAAFAREHGLTFDVLLDRGNIGWSYGARRIPYIVVVDREGVVRHVVRGATDPRALEAAVRATLARS